MRSTWLWIGVGAVATSLGVLFFFHRKDFARVGRTSKSKVIGFANRVWGHASGTANDMIHTEKPVTH